MADDGEPMLRFFEFGHLRGDLQATSEEFHKLAHYIVAAIDRSPERTVCLRKLLEAKDAAVRAKNYGP